MNNGIEHRLDAIELALILFLALATGEPPDATPEEKEVQQKRMAALMQEMTDRFVGRK